MNTLTKTGTRTKLAIAVAVAFGAAAVAMMMFPWWNRPDRPPAANPGGYGYDYQSKCPPGQIYENGACKAQKRGAPRRGGGILGG